MAPRTPKSTQKANLALVSTRKSSREQRMCSHASQRQDGALDKVEDDDSVEFNLPGGNIVDDESLAKMRDVRDILRTLPPDTIILWERSPIVSPFGSRASWAIRSNLGSVISN